MENERSISLGRTILACIVVWNERVESKLGKDHSIRRKTARTLLIKDYANSLTNKILEKLVTYTPLFDNGIKETEDKPMETTH